MIQWLFLYRIDTKAARASIGSELEFSINIGANEAEAALSGTHAAKAWAKVTLNPVIVDAMPVFCVGKEFRIEFTSLHKRDYEACEILCQRWICGC